MHFDPTHDAKTSLVYLPYITEGRQTLSFIDFYIVTEMEGMSMELPSNEYSRTKSTPKLGAKMVAVSSLKRVLSRYSHRRKSTIASSRLIHKRIAKVMTPLCKMASARSISS